MEAALGIDPGSSSVGFCVLHGAKVVDHQVLSRPDHYRQFPAEAAWINEVVETALHLVKLYSPEVVGIETISRPNFHVNKGGAAAKPTYLLATAQVLGALQHALPEAIEVPPGKYGSHPLGSYPEELVSDGERRRDGWQARVGAGNLRHARSAHDIAREARLIAHVQQHQRSA